MLPFAGCWLLLLPWFRGARGAQPLPPAAAVLLTLPSSSSSRSATQAHAKKVLAVAVHNHYKRVEHQMEAARRQAAANAAVQAAAEAEAAASTHRLPGHLAGGVPNMPPDMLHQLGLAALARNPLERVRLELTGWLA